MDVESLLWVFPGELWHWRGPAPYHFIRVPEDVAADLHALSSVISYGWGVIPVKVRIGESDWQTSLFPKDGGYLVPIKDAIRNREGIALGETVLVEMAIRS
jgi:uncharacterized protein DUF1905